MAKTFSAREGYTEWNLIVQSVRQTDNKWMLALQRTVRRQENETGQKSRPVVRSFGSDSGLLQEIEAWVHQIIDIG